MTTPTTTKIITTNNNSDRRGFIKGLLVGIIVTYLNVQLLMLQKVHDDINTTQTTVICSTTTIDNPIATTPTTTHTLQQLRNPVASTEQQRRRKITTSNDVENNPITENPKSIDNNNNNTLVPAVVTTSAAAISSSSQKQEPNIPHRIIITHKYKTLNDIPEPYLSNIYNTISVYRDLWGGEEADIWYLNDDDCQNVIEQVDIRLLKWFWFETRGMYKSDMCRYSALYLKGGYYFDNDMQVVQPIQIQSHIDFVSPFEWGYNLFGNPRGQGLFNSFIAISPKHPIMKKALDYAFIYYDTKIKFGNHMGTGALFKAYVELTHQEGNQMGNVDMSLHETKLTKYMYPNFPRLDGVGCCCDMVVHNTTNQQIYFYSHMVGTKGKVTCGVA